MNVIEAINNIDTNSWAINILDPMPAILKIGFLSSDPNKQFTNLKFRFIIKREKNVVHEGNYPPEFYTYERSDQPYIINVDIPLQPGKTYTLELWAENAGVRSEFNYSFNTPIPNRPYSSWLWTGSDWLPPTPRPTDSQNYEWNESTQQWILDTDD